MMTYFPRQNGPEIQQWPGSAGFTVYYSSTDRSTMSQIRKYQAEVRSASPEWTTRLELVRGGKVRLHVFPKTDVLRSLTAREFEYAS